MKITTMVWSELQTAEVYKNADVVNFIDEHGMELSEEAIKRILPYTPIKIRQSFDGEIEVAVQLCLQAEITTMVKVIQRMFSEQKKAGMSTFDYEETINVNRIPAISKALLSLGIKRFTISSSQICMQDILAEFEKYGWELDALVRITNRQAVSKEMYSDVCEKTKNAFLLLNTKYC